MPYDSLLVATGARHHYFGHPEWEQYAPGLKTIEDATLIRRRVLSAFEQAEREAGPAKVQALLTFVVVGVSTPNPTKVGMDSQLTREVQARGMTRITRHPFLWGTALWALVHFVINGDAASSMRNAAATTARTGSGSRARHPISPSRPSSAAAISSALR